MSNWNYSILAMAFLSSYFPAVIKQAGQRCVISADVLWVWETSSISLQLLSGHYDYLTARPVNHVCDGFKNHSKSQMSFFPSTLHPGDLEGKVKWLDNYQKVKQLRDALVWLPVWERDKRAFVPEVCLHICVSKYTAVILTPVAGSDIGMFFLKN